MLIDAKRVTFTTDGQEYTAALDVAAFVTDADERALGEQWDRIDLSLDATGYARAKREQIRHMLTMNATGRPARVKVVLYEYEADRLTTATLRLK